MWAASFSSVSHLVSVSHGSVMGVDLWSDIRKSCVGYRWEG